MPFQARSALADAQDWLEQALALLEPLPASPALLEQAFEIRLELRPVLTQLGEPRRVLERLREAVLLKDEDRQGRSWDTGERERAHEHLTAAVTMYREMGCGTGWRARSASAATVRRRTVY